MNIHKRGPDNAIGITDTLQTATKARKPVGT